MDKDQMWQVIFSERRYLSADLEPLNDAQWDTRSLCTKWTVRDVVAHMTAAASLSASKFFTQMAGSGFSFEKVQQKGIDANLGDSPKQTLAAFKSIENSKMRPPGPMETMLGETIVHSTDVRGTLGIDHTFPPEALTAAADFFKKSNLIIGSKKRVEGLSLKATDLSWSSGAGPEVSGPMLALLMAMTGRAATLSELSGEGVPTLRSRC
jgi:uncharacterized protein (TIGR03083 family)